MNLVAGSKDYPYHISVGAVLLNSKNEVCVHHFGETEHGGRKFGDFYILMRETPEDGESLIDTLHRGLKEEFGATASARHYMGSIVCDPGLASNKEKTTLYFLCDMESQDIALRENTDIEFTSILEWHPVDFLIAKMGRQAIESGYEDLDESSILERAKQFIS